MKKASLLMLYFMECALDQNQKNVGEKLKISPGSFRFVGD